ncbi:MAG: hypothetical protein IIA17_10395 [candidate division Zixibacteria bacterium]|nr:hypothetical protein [candidate division Zixibacteria bacterium]
MIKRDKIFYSACGLSGVGLILAFMGYDLSLLLFVAAYLLRPALHEFGLAGQYVDERQLEIHSRSGNLAFIIVMLSIVGMVFWRIADGQSVGELHTLIGIGLAARALTGLVMAGEYQKAGVIIISAVGLFLALFIVLDGGFSIVSAFGIAIGLVIVGFGQLGRKFPRIISIALAALAVALIFFSDLLQFRRADLTTWMFFVIPIVTSSVCLFLGSKNEEEVVSARVRSIVFGSLGIGAATVFALLLIIGSGEVHSRGKRVFVPEGETTEVQGVSCTGQIEYYQNGNLEFCRLAREDTLSGQSLPAGTGVHFTEDGLFNWCMLQEDTEIQGYLTRGEGHGFMTEFYPKGQVRTVYLAEDQVIQGIPCAKFRFLSAVFWPVHGKNGGTYFHENGQLKYCELSEHYSVEGQRFRRGDAVRFDQDGKLVAKK